MVLSCEPWDPFTQGRFMPGFGYNWPNVSGEEDF